MGQQPQLDLGVVRIHQHLPRRGHKHLPQLRPQLRADGDILKVRLCGAEPSGGSDGVLEGGVDPSVRSDHLAQPVSIGGFQLGELAVLQDLLNDGVLSPQLLKHLRIGRPSRLCLFHRRQTQALKEDLPQLLGGIDVEGILSGQGIDPGLDLPDPFRQHLSELHQGAPVHQNPFPLHLRQHRAEGQFNLLVQFK